MDKVYAGARALAVLVAIASAFVTIPYVATILLILGGIAAIGNKPEDNIRLYLVAIVLLVGAKELAVIPSVGSYLAVIFGNIGIGAFGAAAVASLIAIWRLTTEAFSKPSAA